MPPSKVAVNLAERMCRPQRVGVFGHRGVGKTTLLTMLYREAVGGRLPDLRLAAANAATARYLADKILHLEGGDVLPATLAESELRFQLYQGGARLELLMRDYQGEHVELGRDEPIREFLRDCDAVWFCFDPAVLCSTAQCLHGQQEAEQLVEDYLALEPQGSLHRPMAVVLTKSDLLPPRPAETNEDEWLTGLAQSHFAMTLHALKEHSPSNALFAVSSLGPRPASQCPALAFPESFFSADRAGSPPVSTIDPTGALEPHGLDQPLRWLANVLQAQDEARMERLFAEGDVSLLGRCLACHARRYPTSPKGAEYERRLGKLTWQRRRRRGIAGLAIALLLLLGLWSYDTHAYHQARRFDEGCDDLEAVQQNWQRYAAWPVRFGSREPVRRRLAELEAEIRQREMQEGVAELRRRADDASSDPHTILEQFKTFHGRYPDAPGLAEVRPLIDARVREVEQREAQRAHDELLKAEQQLPRTGARSTERDLAASRRRLEELVAQADRFLKDFADPSLASKVRQRRDAYLGRLDEHDYEVAQAYSRREPHNFQTRRERYQAYLDRHPGGAREADARAAIRLIESAWDRHDFRQVRDHFAERPAAVKELTTRCERYLLVHPDGRYRTKARELLRWSERVRHPGDYTVTADRGEFSGALSHWYTRGPDLSVEIEVNGIKHGPSGILKNNYNPRWEYEFPRYVRWKMGDVVRIKVIDHDFWGRVVLDVSSDEDDLLSMRMLSGKVEVGEHVLWFASDFNMPKVPVIE